MKRKFLLPLFISSMVLFNAIGASAEPASPFVKLNEKYATPDFITGKLTAPSTESADGIILKYLNKEKGKFKFSGSAEESFAIKSKKQGSDGRTVVRIQQKYNNIPVFGYEQKMVVDSKGVLTSVSGTVLPELDKQAKLKQEAKVKAPDALKAAQDDLGFVAKYEVEPKTELVIYVLEDEASLAHHVNLNFLNPKPGNWHYFVDAVTGKVIDKYNTISHVSGTSTTNQGIGVLGDTKTIKVVQTSSGTYYAQDNTRGSGIYTYDANNGTSLPGTHAYDSDGTWNSSRQKAIVDAHYYAGVTYDYYKNTFNRNSYDGSGALIKSSVHYSSSYNNAFWNGYQMVYGDGDGSTFIPLCGSLDIVAHELTHAVTGDEAGLVYKNESGAISEAYSDIFGTLVEYYANNNPDWKMGEDVYTPGTSGDALRSLSNPTLYGDPDHYSDRYTGSGDYGGVHTNCGIINKAAYLISQGGTHYGVTVTGIGNSKMAAIFYDTLTYYMTSKETMSQLRSHLVSSASYLYGSSSAEVNTVKKAFDSVGVY